MKNILFCILLSCSLIKVVAQNPDVNLLRDINSLDNKGIINTSKALSGSVFVLPTATTAGLLAYGILGKDNKALEQGLTTGASLVASYAVTITLKKLVDRERPFNKYPDITAYANETSPSFPSAHTSLAFSFATSLSLQYPKWYIIAPSYLWATGVGFSRLNLGVHYPTDVMAGALLGTGCAMATYYANKWIRSKWATKHQSVAQRCYLPAH